MKRAIVIILAVSLLILACLRVEQPFSVQDLCVRPENVLTTSRVYCGATDTYIQYVPTSVTCRPPGTSVENGKVYTRLQWTN